jgi:hypothetical protein
MPSNPQWTVTIETKGRSGLIHYCEEGNSALFYWEFGGGRVVAFIQPQEDANRWDETYPWARGRKIEIMEKVARDVCR